MRARSAVVKKAGTIDYELEHQNQKAKILEEDRKNFWRQAQEIKEKNKQEIEKLRGENKKLRQIRDQFIANRKSKPSLAKTATNMSFSSGSNISVSHKNENYLRRVLDKERHLTKTKKNALFTLQDKLKQVEENKLGYIQQSPLMRNIRILQNRLDKVMIKYNEAQSIQKTYEHLVKSLKQQRVGYDSQLAVIQKSLKGRQHDFEELLLLAHDATHAKEAAYTELKRFQQRRITVQEMRVKYVNSKKQQLNKQLPQTFDAPFKPENRQIESKVANNFVSSYKHDQNYQRHQLQDYEEAFRKLKEVTGVMDANEIIQKFKTQGLTTNSLEDLQKSYKLRIEELKRQKESLKQEIQDKKFLRQTGQPERRRLDEIESDMAKVTNQYERTRIKSERLSKAMIDIKAGIQHLKDLTSFYKKEGEQSSQKKIEDDLKNLTEKLLRMYDVVKNDSKYMKRNYNANANAIQNMMKQNNRDYIAYKKEDEQSDQQGDEVDENFILDHRK